MSRVPPIAERAAALVLLAAVLLFIAGFVVLPALERVSAIDADLDHNLSLIERMAARGDDPAAAEARLAELEAEVSQSARFIRAETEALAAASMQQHVKAALDRHGVGTISIQNVSNRADGEMTRVGLRLSLRSGHAPLLAFLAEIETGEPYLFVDGIQISAATWRRQATGQRPEDELTVQLDLFGYMPPVREE